MKGLPEIRHCWHIIEKVGRIQGKVICKCWFRSPLGRRWISNEGFTSEWVKNLNRDVSVLKFGQKTNITWEWKRIL